MSDKIEIKKDTFFKGTIAVLGILLIISIFTGGFGFGANTGGGNAVVNDNGGNAAQPVSMKVLEDTSLYPALGPSDAKHTVIEFADFQCPWCAVASGLPQFAKDAAPSNPQIASVLDSAGKVEELAKQGKVRFIYVSMSFLDDRSSTKESDWTVEAGLCANDQGKFWEMHDLIFTAHDGQENNGKYSKDNLKTMASGISGLDTAKFNSCLDDGDHSSDVSKIASVASQFASGTPTIYVDGNKVSPVWSEISNLLN